MKSEWETEKVFKSHGYDSIKPMNDKAIDHLINYLNFLNLDKYNIVDMGCGNGRIILNLEKSLKKSFNYVGFDCNKYVIDTAKKHFNNNNYTFFYKNIDELTDEELAPYKNWVFLFESTLCMIDNPKKILNNIKNMTKNIILSRTLYNPLNPNIEILNKTNKWGGMENESSNWIFSQKFLEENTSLKFHKKIYILYKKNPEHLICNIYLN